MLAEIEETIIEEEEREMPSLNHSYTRQCINLGIFSLHSWRAWREKFVSRKGAKFAKKSQI